MSKPEVFDTELFAVKKRVVRKKPVNIETITYSFNPIEIMKKLPTDINIYINEFLYDKNGYNEGLVKHFNRQVLYDELFMNKINEIYFQEIQREMDYDDSYMNEYEIAIRKELVKGFYYFASSIIFDDYNTDDGRPTSWINTTGDGADYSIELVDTNELVNKYENNDYINDHALLEKVDAEILFKYIYENLSSFNKDCCLEPTQIRALQKSHNNNAYEILKSYIEMVGSEEQFYEWYVNYFTEDAFRTYYDDDDEDNELSFQDVRKIEIGWSENWIVIFN